MTNIFKLEVKLILCGVGLFDVLEPATLLEAGLGRLGEKRWGCEGACGQTALCPSQVFLVYNVNSEKKKNKKLYVYVLTELLLTFTRK